MFGFTIDLLIRVTTIVGLAGFIVEGGQTGRVSLVLTQEPSADVQIALNYDTSRFSVSGDTLTFTAINYSTAQEVTITAIDDSNDDQGIDTVYITYTVASSDTEYNAYPAGHTEVRIFDNAYDQSTLSTDPAGEFHYTHESELQPLRDSLINWVFESTSLPSGGADSIDVSMAYNAYMNPTGMDSLSQVDKLIINQASSFQHNVYHMIPTTRNNKLMICLYGHGDSYNINGLPTAFEYWLTRGYDVITGHMTARAENDSPLSHITATQRHDSIVTYEGSFNPTSLYLEPWIRAVNHLDSAYNYGNIYMTGISGGGWSTTLLAAIDTRIEKSFDVAGSYPLYIRDDSGQSGSSGDYEQGHSITQSSSFQRDFYSDEVGYLDMYVLAGWQREHWQILNLEDNCCFGGLHWKDYVPEVKRRYKSLSSGRYEFFQYTVPSDHTYNTTVLDKINSRL